MSKNILYSIPCHGNTYGKLELEFTSDYEILWGSRCQPQSYNVKSLLPQGHPSCMWRLSFSQFGPQILSMSHAKKPKGSFKPVFDFRTNRFKSIRLDEWIFSDRGFNARGSSFIWLILTGTRQGKPWFTCFGGWLTRMKSRWMIVMKRWSHHL